MKIIGFAFDAALHCASCTALIFPDIDTLHDDAHDREGNVVHPIFDTDEYLDGDVPSIPYCDNCGEPIE